MNSSNSISSSSWSRGLSSSWIRLILFLKYLMTALINIYIKKSLNISPKSTIIILRTVPWIWHHPWPGSWGCSSGSESSFWKNQSVFVDVTVVERTFSACQQLQLLMMMFVLMMQVVASYYYSRRWVKRGTSCLPCLGPATINFFHFYRNLDRFGVFLLARGGRLRGDDFRLPGSVRGS